jgi:two-component system response regulator FlrC
MLPITAWHTAEGNILEGLVGRTLLEVERRLILKTLEHCHGNRTHTARLLGISLRSLRNKLRDYAAAGMPVPAARSSHSNSHPSSHASCPV